MATNDRCCTIAPYFKVAEGKLPQFKELCQRFIGTTESEAGCLYYGFSFNGDIVHCREGYRNAEALLEHVKNVAPIIEEALKISEIVRIEVHGPESELAKLRGPLADLQPEFYTLEFGFRRG